MRLVIAAGVLLLAAIPAAAVEPGATKQDIINELGKPTSDSALGAKEILTYPNGVRFELQEGRIVRATGIVLSAGDQPTAGDTPKNPGSAAKTAPAKAPAVVSEADAKAAREQKQKEDAAMAAAEKRMADESAKARADMEKSIMAMEEQHAKPVAPKRAFNPLAFTIEFVFRFGFTIGVLKLASKYWSSEVSWRGLAIAAGTDSVVRMVMNVIGVVLLGMPSLFYADEAVAAIALVIVLKQVSYNHSLAKAVEIAMTAKTFSVVVASFLITLALHALS